jgi:hypothetical protein
MLEAILIVILGWQSWDSNPSFPATVYYNVSKGKLCRIIWEDDIKMCILEPRCVNWIQLAQYQVKGSGYVKVKNLFPKSGWGGGGFNVALSIATQEDCITVNVIRTAAK